MNKDEFINPYIKYRGNFSIQNLTFNSNLQEFANRVGIISALETNGKLKPEEAYDKIKLLYKQLKDSKENLLN